MNRTTLPRNGILQTIREQRAIVRAARAARYRSSHGILSIDYAKLEVRALAFHQDQSLIIDASKITTVEVPMGQIGMPKLRSDFTTENTLTDAEEAAVDAGIEQQARDNGQIAPIDTPEAKLLAKRERDARIKRDKRAAAKAEGQKTD